MFRTMKDDASGGVKSAHRVLDILEFLAEQSGAAGLSVIANHFGFPKSSTFALLQTLVDRGYAGRDDADRYALDAVMKARFAPAPAFRLLAAARPLVEALRDEVRETVNLGVLTLEHEVQVVAKAVSPEEVRYDADIAKPRPAYCTAMGRVLLAGLPADTFERFLAAAPFPARTAHSVTTATALRAKVMAASRDGVAVVLDEYILGGSGAAAPVRDRTGRTVAALNIATVTPRFTARRAAILKAVTDHAERISARLDAGLNQG